MAKQDNVSWNRSGEPDQDQRQYRRRRLDEQNFPADGNRAIEPGHDHAAQEKYLDLEGKGRVRLEQGPNKTRGKEAVIEPLVGGEHRGGGGLLRGISEDSQTERFGPKEHLEREKINVQRGDDGH